MIFRTVLRAGLVSLVAALVGASTAPAVTVPFTEDFTDSAADWVNFNASAFLTHETSGGPDGGAFVTGPRVFDGLTADSSTVIFRGRSDSLLSASDEAFVGDWIDAGVAELTAQVRHDAPVPLNYFLRLAQSPNFPGGIFVSFAPVPPNQWTELTFDVSADSPQAVSFEGFDRDTVLSNIARVQLGVRVPESLVDNPTEFTFGLDKVSIAVPEPASVMLVAVGLAGYAVALRRRRVSGPRG